MYLLYIFFFLLYLSNFFFFFFFFNDTATTEIYTLSLHDALPILKNVRDGATQVASGSNQVADASDDSARSARSEEHTSELQSPCNLVCRLLLEKKKTIYSTTNGVFEHCHSTFYSSDAPLINYSLH